MTCNSNIDLDFILIKVSNSFWKNLMKLRSLYQFLKKFFNYPSGGSRMYGRAVSEVNNIFREVLEKKSILPVLAYYRGEHTNPITLKLINKLIEIAEKNLKDPLHELEYFETIIKIDKEYLSTKRRGIHIPVEGGIDRRNRKLILLVYSSSFNLLEESKVLAGLFKAFPVTQRFPVSIYRIAYWNLSKGEVEEVDTRAIIPVDRESLIETANRF